MSEANGGARDTRPKGPRPRSGLGRVARSRSDAPSLIVWMPDSVSIIGTCMSITVRITASIGVAGIGNITIITGNVVGARRTVLSSTAGR